MMGTMGKRGMMMKKKQSWESLAKVMNPAKR
jgi:hypothetical protein